MSPRLAGILAMILSGVGAVVWIAMPDELWPSRVILVLTIAFVVGTFFDLARFPGTSRTRSTMGPVGDALIGFEARVLSLAPLRVEARGAIWSARLVGGLAVSRQALVEVVGRDGLTLLVRPADGWESSSSVSSKDKGKRRPCQASPGPSTSTSRP